VLAQGIPAFGAERALGVDGFDIGVDERRRLLARPRPVRKVEASARFAGTAGCWCVAFQEVSAGVGGKVNAVWGEVSGKPLAFVVGFLVGLPHALLCVGVGFLGWRFWVLGRLCSRCLPCCWSRCPPLRTRCGAVWHRCAVLQEFWVCW
jgi:hypothetical protein